jgi:hypothetical protein
MAFRFDTNLREHATMGPSPKESRRVPAKCTRVATPTITIAPLRIDAASEHHSEGTEPSGLAPFTGTHPSLDQGIRIRRQHLHDQPPSSQLPAKICTLPACSSLNRMAAANSFWGVSKLSSVEAKYNSTLVFINELKKMRWRPPQIADPVGTRSFDCRKPNAATPVAVGDGRSNHLARSVA